MIKLHQITSIRVEHGQGLEATRFSPKTYLDLLHKADAKINRITTVFTSKKERAPIGKGTIEYFVRLERLGRNLPIYPED